MLNKWTDIVGAALILGLVLRYSGEFINIVNAGGGQAVSFFKAVSLQGDGSSVKVA